MALRVSGLNMDVGEALRTRAEARIAELAGKYFNGGYDGHLTLEREGFGYRAECVLHLDTGATLRARAEAGEPTAAFEDMVFNIETRLRRYKRKLKSHRREHATGTAASYVLASPQGEEEVEEDFSPPVIAESTANLRSMSVGEAVMELDMGQLDVVVFRNAGHGGVNVVYRRADGNIGWVDPALTAG